MKKKVLFVLTSHDQLGNTDEKTGYWLSEASHPWHVFKEAGYEMDFMSPKGGMPPVDGKDTTDPVNQAFMNDAKVQEKLTHTLTPGQVDPKDYDVILYVGGHGAMWDLPNVPQIATIAANIYEKGGIVAAVCHGPAGLVNIKLKDGEYLLKGKTVAGFTNEEEEKRGLGKVVPFLLADKLEERGARHVDAPMWTDHIEVDGRLITGQNPASATSLAKAIVKALDAK
ncbi:type 1 glutamine amidotransferase domain-containing protein [Chitinophaga caeni]|uniref:Type 1 glutamine amidotransferase domain-containing protein n=1 Tax=Chitinophaga caeni TaxID=2029983 RepID=A0A291R0N0_9BACT|nr:type 1 glutamine amidotransferase domain-containing protein [Chitinophaga caeni]ATL49735.1 type 1 glutamine amidotransferase domain-containing protein [Chitinophaga caeni]